MRSFGMGTIGRAGVLAGAFLFVLPGCSEEDHGPVVTEGPGDLTEYGDGSHVVLKDGETWIVTGKLRSSCVDIHGHCVEMLEGKGQFCDDPHGQADLLVLGGEVVGAVCYPSVDGGTPIDEVAKGPDGAIHVPQRDNGSVVVFDHTTDKVLITGDLKIDAERTVVFGNGIDVTLLDGNIEVASNNSRLRGLTVTGDLTYSDNSNNSALAFAEVHGSLLVQANGFTAIGAVIFGDVTIEANGAILGGLGVGGVFTAADNCICDGCYSFDDSDGNFDVRGEEVGDPLTCGGKTE